MPLTGLLDREVSGRWHEESGSANAQTVVFSSPLTLAMPSGNVSVPNLPAEGPANQPVRSAGSIKRRTETISVDRQMSSGSNSGAGITLAIGVPR